MSLLLQGLVIKCLKSLTWRCSTKFFVLPFSDFLYISLGTIPSFVLVRYLHSSWKVSLLPIAPDVLICIYCFGTGALILVWRLSVKTTRFLWKDLFNFLLSAVNSTWIKWGNFYVLLLFSFVIISVVQGWVFYFHKPIWQTLCVFSLLYLCSRMLLILSLLAREKLPYIYLWQRSVWFMLNVVSCGTGHGACQVVETHRGLWVLRWNILKKLK